MQILILISSLEYGGAEKQAVNDANMLCEKHSVFLIVFREGPLKSKLDKRVNYQIVNKTGYLKTAGIIAGIVKQNSIQIIHASLFAPMTIAALVSMQVKSKIIWNFHSHEYEIPWKSKLSLIIFSRLKSVKKITYVNNELECYFKKRLKLTQNKAVILYNSTELKTRPKKILLQKQGIVNIGYVGRLVELKRVEYLVDLAKHLVEKSIQHFTMHILGDGDTRDLIEKKVGDLGLNKYFIFYGFKTNLEEYYNMFDIFINPSREECLSIALIDAGISAIPSIAFEVGGNDEIINHGKTGFIVKTKEELFTRTIQLIEDSNLRVQFGMAAQIHCTKHFTESVRKERLEQIFADVI